MTSPAPQVSVLLAVMADGIGNLTFGTTAWVDAARTVLIEAVSRHATSLCGLGRFTLCEVAHNPPAYLHGDATLAWHATIDGSGNGASVEVHAGELPTAQCTFKVAGDHSIISNLARIQYHDKDPALIAAAQTRLQALSRWDVHGAIPAHPVLGVVLRTLHDRMALRTMPRFTFMTPEWVSSARHILCSRAASEKYAAGLADVQYIFAEEFTDTPRYAFPDGAHGGFWVQCNFGHITVGAGPLPAALGPADVLTKGAYTPVVPVGRTVNAAMNDAEKAEHADYSKRAFRFDKAAGAPPVTKTSPSGKGEMPAGLARVFVPLHDELSKRTSGELPSDYDNGIRAEWAAAQTFDRAGSYDKTWLRLDKVDIYGAPRTR